MEDLLFLRAISVFIAFKERAAAEGAQSAAVEAEAELLLGFTSGSQDSLARDAAFPLSKRQNRHLGLPSWSSTLLSRQCFVQENQL